MSTIKERVKSFEDACEVLGINPEEFKITYPDKVSHHGNALAAHAKLVIITEALNEGWKPDWNNGKWDKWYPWFYMSVSSSSGRFSFVGSDGRRSHSDCGSRLCLKSEELADYAGTQFEELYKEYFVID